MLFREPLCWVENGPKHQGGFFHTSGVQWKTLEGSLYTVSVYSLFALRITSQLNFTATSCKNPQVMDNLKQICSVVSTHVFTNKLWLAKVFTPPLNFFAFITTEVYIKLPLLCDQPLCDLFSS